MIARILQLPQPWVGGTQNQVVVDINGAPPGQVVDVELFLTMPAPERSLGNQKTNVSGSGTAQVTFPVTLTKQGINVLHCEATHANDFDSDSNGTVVI